MPKQTFKIESFHGGLNSNSDPRDIRDDESPNLRDVAIDSIGKIKTFGKFDDGNIINSGTAQAAGSGVFTLASSASSSDDFYNGYHLFVQSGTGSGGQFVITDYVGSTKVASFSEAGSYGSDSVYIITSDKNTLDPLHNKGLFVMSSDRKIDGTLSDETLIFCYDNGSNTIDIKDSDDWNTAKITFDGSASPMYYNADGVVRVSDSNLVRDPEWFGYVIDERFDGLNADSGSIGWINVDQKLTTPTSGKCLISTPIAGSDSSGIFSSSSEYIGSVINAGIHFNVVDHSAVNLRVGIQLNEIIASGHADWDFNIQQTNNPSSDSTDIYPCIGTAVTQIVGTGSGQTFASIGVNGLDYTIGDNQCLIVSIFFTTSEYGDLRKIKVSGGSVGWEFGLDDIKPNMWNLLVCSGDNINSGSENFPIDSSASDFSLFIYDNHSGGAGSTDVTYYVSGVAIAESQGINSFTPNTYTFHHTYLYDVENKQESLPFKFNDVDLSSTFTLSGSINPTGTNVNAPGSGTKYTAELKIGDEITVSGETRVIASITDDTTATVTVAWGSDLANDTSVEVNPIGEPDNLNSINVVGSSVLFNFDTYICSNVAAGNAYGLNKRISGSRLYYKKEENDNYFLIGELDFVDKGFKFLPEADILSYTMTNTTNTSGNILSKTALIKGISPETANTIDTFKTINGFSTEVKSLDAKYKTAVVHGRRVYIGNIKRPNGKTYPDRIVKSQVNRFDTFPEGMGSVDVVIRDGESIVKLEAYADRILQFKQHSLYIINVSESVDFLEDTFRNKGCAFDYHVVRTDMGVAWFNDHGCYLYNGRNVIDLLEKKGIKSISESDWSGHVKEIQNNGTFDDATMQFAHIAYIPKTKQLLIKNNNRDCYIYDFVLLAWTFSRSTMSLHGGTNKMTNFALDGDQDLFFIDGLQTTRKTFLTSSQSQDDFIYNTKDIDFGQPSIRKKIYRVRINYKGDGSSLNVRYSINGDTDTYKQFQGTSSGLPSGSAADTPLENKSSDLTQWYQAELKPNVSSESNNIYSFQVHMTGSVDASFEINDITIIYRLKNVK